MSKISGSCLCGSVIYSSSANPVLVAVCHCSNCQKQTGSSFSIIVAVPTGKLQFNSNEPAVYEDSGISDMPLHRHFCSKCGSPIFSDVESTPELQYVKAGTLDNTSWLNPTLSIWCDRAQTWFTEPDQLVKFPQNPPAQTRLTDRDIRPQKAFHGFSPGIIYDGWLIHTDKLWGDISMLLASDLGIEIDFGFDEPGLALQRQEMKGWQDYLADGEPVPSPVDVESLPPGKYRLLGKDERNHL